MLMEDNHLDRDEEKELMDTISRVQIDREMSEDLFRVNIYIIFRN